METNKDFLISVEDKIRKLGLQKKYVAQQINLDQVRFSQSLKGKRNFTQLEISGLRNFLGITA
jgi:hypothetical protein